MLHPYARPLAAGLLITCLLGSSLVRGEKEPAKVKDEASHAETMAVMQRFLGHMVALKKFFVSEEKFSDPANQVEIETHLKEFAELARGAVHDPVLRKENFKFSRQILENHITETERVFRLGNKSYARWMLNSTSAICMSCHTQIPATNRSFSEFEKLNEFANDFDRAEFLFATRAFTKAAELYEHVILTYPQSDLKNGQLDTALAREVSYYARILRDPKRAVSKLESFLVNRKIPEPLRAGIRTWISEFKTWQAHPDLNPAKAQGTEVVDFAQKALALDSAVKSSVDVSNPHLVGYLHVSGLLYEYLQAHPNSPQLAQILYLLSLCDRSLSNTVFYSLADLYLRECVVRFPTDPVAQKCYKEYEDETIFSYTGSAGTNVPADVRTDLNNLKKLLETANKVETHEH